MNMFLRALAIAALAGTLALGGCADGKLYYFDTLGSIGQQLNPKPVPQVSAQPVDADINQASTYQGSLELVNGAYSSTAEGNQQYATAIARAADSRMTGTDPCVKGVQTQLVVHMPSDEGYPDSIRICKGKSPRVKILIGPATVITTASSGYIDGRVRTLVVDGNLNGGYRDLTYREMAIMDDMDAISTPAVKCPAQYVVRRSTLSGTVTPQNPAGKEFWSCYFHPTLPYFR